MDVIAQIIIPVTSLLCSSLTAIIVAIIGYYGAKANKSIKKISGNLPSWDLLYEHDENGNPINGSIERLIEAVNQGYPVKIKIYQPHNIVQVMDAQLLSVESRLVHASNTDQISQTRDASGNYVYQDKAYHYYVIASSNGHFHAKRIFLTGEERNTSAENRRMAWIGLVPPKGVSD